MNLLLSVRSVFYEVFFGCHCWVKSNDKYCNRCSRSPMLTCNNRMRHDPQLRSCDGAGAAQGPSILNKGWPSQTEKPPSTVSRVTRILTSSPRKPAWSSFAFLLSSPFLVESLQPITLRPCNPSLAPSLLPPVPAGFQFQNV